MELNEVNFDVAVPVAADADEVVASNEDTVAELPALREVRWTSLQQQWITILSITATSLGVIAVLWLVTGNAIAGFYSPAHSLETVVARYGATGIVIAALICAVLVAHHRFIQHRPEGDRHQGRHRPCRIEDRFNARYAPAIQADSTSALETTATTVVTAPEPLPAFAHTIVFTPPATAPIGPRVHRIKAHNGLQRVGVTTESAIDSFDKTVEVRLLRDRTMLLPQVRPASAFTPYPGSDDDTVVRGGGSYN